MINQLFEEEKDATCADCGHPLQIVRPGKYRCEFCELRAAFWQWWLKDEAMDILGDIDFMQVVLEIRPERSTGKRNEIRALLKQSLARRLAK